MKLLSILNIVAIGAAVTMLWLQNRDLVAMSAELNRISLRDELTTDEATEADLAGTTFEGQLRRADEIDDRMTQVEESDATGFAVALSDVDEWMFYPEDQEAATKKFNSLLDDLRAKISVAISGQLEQALKAPSGAEADVFLINAGDLFSLFPQPETDDQKQEARKLSTSISSAGNRVAELRRLRYNQWAANGVQASMDGYYKKKKTFGDDDPDLIKNFIDELGTVDPNFLDPAVAGIYQHVLSITTDALEESKRVDLARKLSSSDIHRKSPIDF